MVAQRSRSFCGKPEREVARLHEGPRDLICDECVALCVEIFDEGSGKPPAGLVITCSFCGETQRARYVAGPTVHVCDVCVRMFDTRRAPEP